MERCDRSFHGEELSDDKNVPTICVLCTNERQFANQSEISTQIPDALLKNKEKHSTDEIAGLLRQYYEGAPLFYSKEPPKAKVFKPILLYHSCSKGDSSSRENSLHGFCKSDRIPLAPDDSQHRYLKTTLTDTEIHGRSETTTLERDEKTPVDILQHPDDNSGRIHSNVRYKTSKEVESLPCGVQSEKIAVKSEFIQPLFSAANETLQYSYHRSAFSQPRRFPDFLPDYSDIMDTYVRSSLKLQRAAHSSTEFCGFQCFRCGHPVCLNTDGYINANMQSFTCSGCSSFLPSNRFQHCVGENCLGDLSFHPELGTTRHLPIFSHTYNSYHYEFLKFSPPLHSNQIVEAQCKIHVSEKTQGDCIYDSQDFLQSDSSVEVVPKKIQKVAAVEKPYKCKCGRSFARNEELTRHMRIHSGHRPFQCSLCAKSFGRKDHLKKHRTTHLHISEKKVHVCNIEDCQQRYTRSDALARHQWAIHGIRANVPK